VLLQRRFTCNAAASLQKGHHVRATGSATSFGGQP
jgi:hypothetical protein